MAAQFTSEGTTLSGVDLELVGSGYRMSLVKRRFATGTPPPALPLPSPEARTMPGPEPHPLLLPGCGAGGIWGVWDGWWGLGPGGPGWCAQVGRVSEGRRGKGGRAPVGRPCEDPRQGAGSHTATLPPPHSPTTTRGYWGPRGSGTSELQGCLQEDWGIPGEGQGTPLPSSLLTAPPAQGCTW